MTEPVIDTPLLAEPLFRALIQHGWDSISLVNADATFRYVSPATIRILGFTERELVGRNVFDLMHPDDQQHATDLFNAVLHQRAESVTAQLRYRHKDGSWKWLDGICTSLLAEPAVQAVVLNFRDITDRKQAEEALRESSQLNKQIIASVHEGVVAYDRELRYVLWNPYMEEMSGLSSQQVVGKHPWAVFPYLREMGVESLLRRALAGEVVIGPDVPYLMPGSGKSGWASGQFSPLRHTSGEIVGVIGTVRDITERKRNEEQLLRLQHQSAELAALLDTLVSNAPVGIGFVDREFRFRQCNPALAVIDGSSVEDHLGRTVQEVIPSLWSSLEPIYRRVLDKEEAVTNLEVNGETPAAPGRVRHWFANYYPVKAEEKYIGCGILVSEVTEQREAEKARRELEVQMQHTQKLESLGVMAGGLAHDFNNLLTGVLGNACLALQEMPPGSALHDTIKAIETAALRAADLTKQMLAYAGKGRFVIQSVHLSRVVEEMATLLNRVISKKAVLRFEFADDLPLVEADATQLRQIVMNLITNASDSLGDEDGVITLRTRMVSVDPFSSAMFFPATLSPGRYVSLEVSDTGSGMDEATKTKIFEPFFTTKFTGRGLEKQDIPLFTKDGRQLGPDEL
jgi:two-component system, cell cycle sensor histidine kinase and response regulator CckA